MKRFRFALRGLEKVRQSEVDRAYRKLAESERARRSDEEELMALTTALEAGWGQVARTGRVDGAALDAEANYVGLLRHRRAAVEVQLGERIAQVEADRQQLMAARRELKAIERLRERRYLEFLQEVMRDEREQLDDLGGQRHQRRVAA